MSVGSYRSMLILPYQQPSGIRFRPLRSGSLPPEFTVSLPAPFATLTPERRSLRPIRASPVRSKRTGEKRGVGLVRMDTKNGADDHRAGLNLEPMGHRRCPGTIGRCIQFQLIGLMDTAEILLHKSNKGRLAWRHRTNVRNSGSEQNASLAISTRARGE